MLDYRVFTFLTLCDEMNYRRTAELLNMTQPGVTQHIHYLEKYYGVKLFEYDGRSLRKTKAAEKLQAHFRSMHAGENHIRQDLVDSDTIHITIGATKTIGEFVIVPEIKRFLDNPQHNLELVIDNTENLLHMLEHSLIDFAIVEGVFDKSKYNYHLYKKENFTGICSTKHPFANKSVPLEDVFEENIVVREKSSGTRKLLTQLINSKGFSLESFARCTTINNFSVLCDIVTNNQGISFAYEPISKCKEGLATFSIEGNTMSGEFNFVYFNRDIALSKIRTIFGDK